MRENTNPVYNSKQLYGNKLQIMMEVESSFFGTWIELKFEEFTLDLKFKLVSFLDTLYWI